jgi:hypothetical protein
VSRARRQRVNSGTEREVIRFRTETRSVYEVARTTDGMSWQRISATFASGVLRNEGARLVAWPDVRVGKRCRLLSEPLHPPHPRLVWTTEVVAILEQRSSAPKPEAHPTPNWLHALKAGETVTRLLGGSIPMRLVVTEIDERFIYCGRPGAGWMFDRDTGIEVDEELGWGPQFGITGSFLVPEFDERIGEGS